MADTVDRSSGNPIVAPITGLIVLPRSTGFDLSWDASLAVDLEDYLVTRNDGQTFRTTSTGLHDNSQLIPMSFYWWTVSVHAGQKSSVLVTSAKFQF